MNCCTPGFPVHHQLLELAQTHVYTLIIYYVFNYSKIKISKRSDGNSHAGPYGAFLEETPPPYPLLQLLSEESR